MPNLDGPRWGPREPGPAQQLIVILHGLGADGHDLIDLGPYWGKTLPHAAFVAPDAPYHYALGPMGRQWFDRAKPEPEPAAAMLSAFIDSELARLSLAADAYAIMGFSQGAMMALQTGLRRATPPKAVLALSGALLSTENITAKPPVLLIHGALDDVVPSERSVLAEQQLIAAGIPATLHIVPTLNHSIDDTALSLSALFLQRAFA